jgi:hypothetical protein
VNSIFPAQPNDNGYYYSDNRADWIMNDAKNPHRFIFYGIVDQKWGCQFVEIRNEQMKYGEFVSDDINVTGAQKWFFEGKKL